MTKNLADGIDDDSDSDESIQMGVQCNMCLCSGVRSSSRREYASLESIASSHTSLPSTSAEAVLPARGDRERSRGVFEVTPPLKHPAAYVAFGFLARPMWYRTVWEMEMHPMQFC